MGFDLVIVSSKVLDGTSWPRFWFDLGIRDGGIAAVPTDEPLIVPWTPSPVGWFIVPSPVDVPSRVGRILSLPDCDGILASLLFPEKSAMDYPNFVIRDCDWFELIAPGESWANLPFDASGRHR